MKILITGKNGQLGQSISKVLENNKEYYDKLNFCQFKFVGKKELNFANKFSVQNFFNNNCRFDIIVNCAAYTAVDEAEKNLFLANQINNIAVEELAKIAKAQKSKLIHISTDYVFDGKSKIPYLETDKTSPLNVYGKSKLDGEIAIQKIMKNNAIIIRTSWLYSQFGFNFVKTMLKFGKEREIVNVIDDQIGSPTRAKDLSEAIINIINNKNYQTKTHKSGIFHFSNEGIISWFDFAKEIFKLSNSNCKAVRVKHNQFPTLAKRPKFSVMNKNKIQKQFNIDILNWKKALSEYIRETKE